MAKSEEAGTQAAGSRQPEWHEAGGRGQEAEGGGQRKPRTGGGIGATPCPGAGPSPSTTCCRSTTGCTSLPGRPAGGRGWGGDWVVGVVGQQDQAGWFAQHPEAPQRLAGADAFSDRRRARAAARQQVRVSRGGCGGRQPLAAAERRRQILVKWQKMFLEKIVVFRAFGGRLGLCWWAQAWGPPPSPPRPSLGTGMASGGVRGGPPHAAGRVLWTPGPPLACMPGSEPAVRGRRRGQ